MDNLTLYPFLPGGDYLLAFVVAILAIAVIVYSCKATRVTASIKSSPGVRGASYSVSNYGNHVGSNHGTITQMGGDASYTSALALGEEKELTVNGRHFKGQLVERKDGRIFVDGRDVTNEVVPATGQINIVVQGDVVKLVGQGINHVTVTGNAGDVTSTTGQIEIKGNVTGDVGSTNGSITCGNVSGAVNSVNGTISTR